MDELAGLPPPPPPLTEPEPLEPPPWSSGTLQHGSFTNIKKEFRGKWVYREKEFTGKMSLQGASWQWVGDNNWLTLIIFNDNFIVTTDDLHNATIFSPLTPVSTECPRIWMLPSLPTRLRSFSGGWHHECDSEQPRSLETHWWPLLQPHSRKIYSHYDDKCPKSKYHRDNCLWSNR